MAVKKIAKKASGRIGVGWAAALLAGSALFGNLLGLLRERLIIANFGFTIQTDAYNAAFALPDFMLYILVSGALSVSFIPIFSQRYHGGNKKSAWEITSSLLNLIAMIMMVSGVFIFFFAAPILRFITPGLDQETQFLAVSMMRIFSINSILFGVSSVLSSVQQAKGRFLFYALAPSVYSLGIIFGTIVLSPRLGIMGVAYGVVVGAIAQLLVVAYGIRGQGFVYSPKVFWKNKGLKQILRIAPVRSLDQGIDYFTSLIELNRASLLPIGSIAAYGAATKLFNVPVGLVGMAISTAAFPKMNERLSQGRPDLFKKELQETIKIMFWLAVPATIITYFCRGYFSRILVSRGSQVVPAMLGILASMVIFKVLYHILARAFYAQHDTKTPLKISIAAMIINVVLLFWLSRSDLYGLSGIALASVISGSAEVIILGFVLNRKLAGGLFTRNMLDPFIKTVIIGGLTSLVTYFMVNILPLSSRDVGFFPLIPKFLTICVVSGLAYLSLSYWAKIGDVRGLTQKALKLSKKKIVIE